MAQYSANIFLRHPVHTSMSIVKVRQVKGPNALRCQEICSNILSIVFLGSTCTHAKCHSLTSAGPKPRTVNRDVTRFGQRISCQPLHMSNASVDKCGVQTQWAAKRYVDRFSANLYTCQISQFECKTQPKPEELRRDQSVHMSNVAV